MFLIKNSIENSNLDQDPHFWNDWYTNELKSDLGNSASNIQSFILSNKRIKKLSLVTRKPLWDLEWLPSSIENVPLSTNTKSGTSGSVLSKHYQRHNYSLNLNRFLKSDGDDLPVTKRKFSDEETNDEANTN